MLTTPGMRAIGVLLLLLGLGALRAPRAAENLAPAGWTNGECMECHPGETRHWKASRHGQSFDNPHFQSAWNEARYGPWCLGCHQPDGDPVTCTTCHRSHGPPEDDVCAGCHEFVGPTLASPFELGGDLLQSTVTEWQATPAGRDGRTCADCHLEGHRFRGAHDASFVRSAMTIEVSEDALTLSTTAALGHRLPTGDPFRFLELLTCADAACGDILGRAVLGVRHEADADGKLRVTRDTRLGPPGGDAPSVLTLPRPEGATHWRVRLNLADPTLVLPAEERVLPLDSGAFP